MFCCARVLARFVIKVVAVVVVAAVVVAAVAAVAVVAAPAVVVPDAGGVECCAMAPRYMSALMSVSTSL